MRVALCFGSYPPERNGGSDFVARLAAALAEHGVEVHVLTSGDGSVERDGPVVVHRAIRDWRLRGGDRRRFRGVVAEIAPDVMHVLFPDSVLQERFQLPVATPRGIPLVTTWWNLALGRRSPPALRALSAALMLRSRVLTSHEPRALGVLRQIAARRPAEWLPVGNNLEANEPLPGREDARAAVGLGPGDWLGYFGQLDPTRGVEDLFEALALLRRTRDVRLLMIGSAGRPERYRDQATSSDYLDTVLALPARLGLAEEAVCWTDYLPDREVMLHLRAVDLCVLPYRRNSIGRSALAAALAAGAPTILAGSPSGIEPLADRKHVALVPPADPQRLAATVEALLADTDERARLAEAASGAADFFSWPSIAGRAAEIYARAARR